MKASDLFLRCLEAQGIDTIYGVPGEENADLMISLLHSPIEFITCRHEQSAAFMADMQGRLTEKPGVCLATLGPGATNLITGVANANMDHSPLIAIVGQASTTRLHKESHQNMDSVSMYKPVTKWATTIREAEVIPEVVARAYKIATEEKPGAVMIELPEDIAKQEVTVEPIKALSMSVETSASPHKLAQTCKLIAESKAPLLLLGAGCNRCNCHQELLHFVDYTGIYFAVTFMGKGAVSTQHPQSLYCVGLGMKDICMEAFDQADLVICIGYDMVEWHPERWNAKQQKKIIHIDYLPAEVDRDYIPDVEMIGNIKNIVNQINQHLKRAQKKDKKLFAEIRTRIQKEIYRFNEDNDFPIKPQRILHDLRKVLGENDILISDVGAHKMWIARQYDTYQPKSCFIYNGFCSMGGAIPGAVAAKRLYPDKNVVALCGDGGFIMSMQAIVTATQLKLPIIIVIWQDNFYGLIKWKQETNYQTYSHVDLVNPDFVKLGEALDCIATRITAVNELEKTFKTACEQKEKPTVIVIPVDYEENLKLTKHLIEIVSK
jgi:acetolactate synthase-1/2/3 large subunit